MTILTQDEYNVAKQTNRYLHIKINLLNHKFQLVDELSGTLIGTPTFSINSESDIRRTCSFSLVPTTSSFDIKNGNKIWLDKYVQIYIGIENNRNNEIVYTNQGIYLVNNPNTVYTAVNHTITIQGLDLMAKMTGLRNGNLEGLPVLIPQGSNIRDVIIQTIKLAGFERYIISDFPIDLPYDIRVDIGGTVYEILSKILEILPNYEMYFDVDGVFHFNEIPSGKNEQIYADDDIWKMNLIDYSRNYDFSEVKNVIEVFGKTHDIQNFGGDAIVQNNIYQIKIDGLKELRNYLKIGFITKQKVVNPRLKINELKDYPIKNEDGTIPNLSNEENYYVVKFKEDYNKFNIIKIEELKEIYNGNLLTTIENSTYKLSNSTLTSLTNGMKVEFVTPKIGNSDIYQPEIKINELETIKIETNYPLKNNTKYTIQYYEGNDSNNYFVFMGNVQSHAIVKEENPSSPFYVKGNLGEIRIVLTGGEYENIYTDDLALDRAKWELYRRCRLLDSVTLNCLPVFWLDVNKVISITLPNKTGNEEKNLYIIKSINTTYGVTGTQTITCMRYYPYYDKKGVIN